MSPAKSTKTDGKKLRHKFLIVESEEETHPIGPTLARVDCEPTHASNLMQAIDLLDAVRFDMLLVKHQYPSRDIFQIAELVRKKNELYFTDLPIFGVFPEAPETTISACSGITDYIICPYQSSDLNAMINFHLKLELELQDIVSHIMGYLYGINNDKEESMYYLEAFHLSLEQDSDGLKNAIVYEDLNEIKEYAHRNKITYQLVGLTKIGKNLHQIEKMIFEQCPPWMILNKIRAHDRQASEILKQMDKNKAVFSS